MSSQEKGLTVSPETQARPETSLWLCEVCFMVYDPAAGDEDGGIPPGTAFEDIPADWVCPICGAAKGEFRLMEPGEQIPEIVY